MALAAPLLEQTYRYPIPSSLDGERRRSAASARDVGRPVGEPASSFAAGSSCRWSRPTCC